MANALRSKNLYRIPEAGLLKGVCAGLAHYFNIPVKLLRVMVVLSLFFGLFIFTIAAYIILTFVLDPVSANHIDTKLPPTPASCWINWSISSLLMKSVYAVLSVMSPRKVLTSRAVSASYNPMIYIPRLL